MSIPNYKRKLRRVFASLGKAFYFKVSYYQPHPRYTDLFYRNNKHLIKIGNRKKLHELFELTERQAWAIQNTFNEFISYYACTGNPFNWDRFFTNVNRGLGYLEYDGSKFHDLIEQSTLIAFQHFILTQLPDEEHLHTINSSDLNLELATQ